MTTIFRKEIERLEKEIEEKSKSQYHRHIEISFIPEMKIDNGEFDSNCNTCLEIQELYAELKTLKQAEQKHLKFVEELKKEELEFLNEIQTKTKDIDTMMFCKLRMSQLKKDIMELNK